MDALTTLSTQPDTQAIIQTVLDAVDSPHTKRAYHRALTDFMAWYQASGQSVLNKATVQRYAQELHAQGVSAASINQRLSAIRKLAVEASDNGMIPDALANGIRNVKGIRQEGKRLGNWLDKKQAQAMLRLPDIETLKGLRDRAILAVLLGAGLRRQEAASLTFEHIQQREGRWVIVNLVGKRNKTRSVPISSWVKSSIESWSDQAHINTGHVFRPINKGDRMTGESMTDQAIYNTINTYAEQLNVAVAPHDLRRTFAKLAHKGGAAIEQIQLSLGHASLKTTEIYLGVDQDLVDAPGDHLGLRL